MEGCQGEEMKSEADKRSSLSTWNWSLSVILKVCLIFFTPFPSFSATTDNRLVFLGNKNIAPVVYLDNGIPAGVAVDIVHAIAGHLPQPVEIKAMDWSEAQSLVARGEADALIQINETEERKKIYDFSDSLLESHFSIFTRAGKLGISGLSNLRGLKVGVESGGLPRKQLENDPQIQIIIIPDFKEGFKSLSEGAIDAVVVDYRVGSYILSQSNIQNIKVTGDPISTSYSSFAVKKGNTKLIDEINHALASIKTDGTYQNILDKWKPKEGVFRTQEQITRIRYNTIVTLLSILILISAVYLIAYKKELFKRKRAEERSKEQHSTLLGIVNSMDALIYSVDKRYRYTSFNLRHAVAMKALYGAEIMLGQGLLECMTVPEDRETAKRNIDRALAGEYLVEESYSGEEIRSRRFFRVSHSPVKTEEEIVGVAVLAQDITDRKQVEEEVARVASFPLLNPQPVTEVDMDGRISFVNPTARRLFPDLEELGANHPWLQDWDTLAAICCGHGTTPDDREVAVADRWYRQTMYLVPEERRLRIYGFDITERKLTAQTPGELRTYSTRASPCIRSSTFITGRSVAWPLASITVARYYFRSATYSVAIGGSRARNHRPAAQDQP
jgi:PAS domain S-box-containing protein